MLLFQANTSWDILLYSNRYLKQGEKKTKQIWLIILFLLEILVISIKIKQIRNKNIGKEETKLSVFGDDFFKILHVKINIIKSKTSKFL